MAGESRDGLFAWLVALMSCLSNVLLSGVMMAVGVYHVIFMEQMHGCSNGQVALISSLNTGVCYGIGQFTLYLIMIFCVKHFNQSSL